MSNAEQTKKGRTPILIIWSDSTTELFTYALRPGNSNQVQVQLVVDGKVITEQKKERPGGIEQFAALSEKAVQEITQKRTSVKKSNESDARKLAISVTNAEGEHHALIEGDLKELTRLFQDTVALKEILKYVSENQPKAYRLIDEPGPLKQRMRKPDGF